MADLTDHELLAEFARNESGEAFAELVSRFVNLVYSAALRFTGNPHHAEEITQVVFIILARKAGKLSPRFVLSGWLYQTTRLTAANFMKGEIRRQRREQEAYMQSTSNEPDADPWPKIAPLLEDAMGKLGETDRAALVLRFFENKSSAEIAAALKVTEEAARQRVSRAVEKLRKIFSRRGVVSTGAIITGAISANSVHAAPVVLAKAVTVVAIARGATAGSSTLILIKGALKLMAWTKAKTAVLVGASVLLVAGTTLITVKEIKAHRTLTIRMHVDGSDVIKMSGAQLWIEHRDFLLTDSPIYVNGKPWSPKWNGNVSTSFSGLSPAFNSRDPRKIELKLVAGRGEATIEELPTSANGQTLSVMLNDKDYDGTEWYEVVLSW